MIKKSIALIIICLKLLYSQDLAFLDDNNSSTMFLLEECDACGCSATGGNFGFGDLQQKNKITLRYLNQNYKSKETIFNDSPWSNEHFGTIQLLGLVSISQKIKVLGIIPYQILTKQSSTSNSSNHGIGDISLLGIYNFLNKDIDTNININWLGGIGIKFPTGRFDQNFGGSLNPGFQLGTGSLDQSYLTELTFNYNDWGWQHMLNYLYKTSNKFDFKFGNQWNYFTNFYKKIDLTNSKLIPTIGYAYEFSYENIDFGVIQPNTKAYAHIIKVGTDFSYKNALLGFHYFQPVAQNLFNETVELRSRFNVSLQYNL